MQIALSLLLFLFVIINHDSYVLSMENSITSPQSLTLLAARSVSSQMNKQKCDEQEMSLPDELAEVVDLITEITAQDIFLQDFLLNVTHVYGFTCAKKLMNMLHKVKTAENCEQLTLVFQAILADANRVFISSDEQLFNRLKGAILSRDELLSCDMVIIFFLLLLTQDTEDKEQLIDLLRDEIKNISLSSKNAHKGIIELIMGLMYVREKHEKKAMSCLELCARDGRACAQHCLGLIYQQKQNFMKARDYFEQAVAQDYRDSLMSLAITCTQQRDTSAAKMWLKNLLRTDESGEAYHALATCFSQEGHYVKMKKKLVQAANCGLNSVHTSLGLVYAQEGELEKAESSFKNALISSNRSVDAYHELARFYVQQERISEAISCLELLGNQGTAETYYMIGALSLSIDIPKGVTYLEKAAEIGHPQADYGLGRIYKNQSMMLAAKKHLQKAAEERSTEAAALLGKIYKKKANKKIKAEKYLSLAADSGHICSMRRLGHFYYQNNQPEKALIYLKQAAEHQDVTAQFYLGYIYYLANDKMQASYYLNVESLRENQEAREILAKLG